MMEYISLIMKMASPLKNNMSGEKYNKNIDF